eukprot:3319646-Rhodomonas_salina.1
MFSCRPSATMLLFSAIPLISGCVARTMHVAPYLVLEAASVQAAGKTAFASPLLSLGSRQPSASLLQPAVLLFTRPPQNVRSRNCTPHLQNTFHPFEVHHLNRAQESGWLRPDFAGLEDSPQQGGQRANGCHRRGCGKEGEEGRGDCAGAAVSSAACSRESRCGTSSLHSTRRYPSSQPTPRELNPRSCCSSTHVPEKNPCISAPDRPFRVETGCPAQPGLHFQHGRHRVCLQAPRVTPRTLLRAADRTSVLGDLQRFQRFLRLRTARRLAPPTVLRASYALPGTDFAYDPTKSNSRTTSRRSGGVTWCTAGTLLPQYSVFGGMEQSRVEADGVVLVMRDREDEILIACVLWEKNKNAPRVCCWKTDWLVVSCWQSGLE